MCDLYDESVLLCASVHVVKRARTASKAPGSLEEVRLRDGICGARDLVYFPPWIPVLPAGFSQVLASISLGSCWEEGVGVEVTALECVTHSSAQLCRWKERRQTCQDKKKN